MPEYATHPGTVVLGGARPPPIYGISTAQSAQAGNSAELGRDVDVPQSRNSQISPVSGTYQIKLAPPYATVADETQPAKSVLAAMGAAKSAAATARAVRANMSKELCIER